MKARGAKFNTHILTTNGLISYDEMTMLKPKRVKVDIRCTSDERAESISLTVNNIQIMVDVKDVEKIIEEARNESRKHISN